MRRALSRRWLSLVVVAVVALVAAGIPADAGNEEDPRTANLHPMGHIEEPRSLIRAGADPNIHTDIAFWGKHAFQGTWLGFNDSAVWLRALAGHDERVGDELSVDPDAHRPVHISHERSGLARRRDPRRTSSLACR